MNEQQIDAAVKVALAERGLDPSYQRTVKELVLRTGDEWRICCGSGCDPCIELIGPVVDRARAMLGIEPTP